MRGVMWMARDRIDAEPQPADRRVEPPGWLSAEAREVWGWYAPDLIRRRLLTAWDVDTFAVLCDAVAQYRAASAWVARAGVMVTGRRDAAVKNPAMQLVRDTAQTIRAYAQEFGLTPSARSGLRVEEELARGRTVERLLS